MKRRAVVAVEGSHMEYGHVPVRCCTGVDGRGDWRFNQCELVQMTVR